MNPHYKKLFFAVLFSVISTALFSQKLEIKNHTQLSYISDSSEFTINLDMSVDGYPDAELIYTSSSSLKHAVIDGKLYVDGFGDVTITASCKNHSDVNTQTFIFSFISLNSFMIHNSQDTLWVKKRNRIKYIGDTCDFSINLGLFQPIYTSTDNSVITVDSNGLVKAVGAGSATLNIKVDSNDLTIEIPFTIAERPDTFKYFTSSSFTIMKGNTVSLPINAEFNNQVTIDTLGAAKFADIDFVNKTIKAKREGIGFSIIARHITDSSIETLFIVVPSIPVVYPQHYFLNNSITLTVGKSIKLTINPNYINKQNVTIEEPNSPLIGKFNRADSTVTGLSVGEYPIVARMNDSIIDKILIIITEPVDTLNITQIKILNYGYTVEITFDKPIELYEGIEKDFTITYENSTPLKSNNSYEVKKVMAKTGDPYTLVLTFDTPVPSSNIMVSFKEDVSFTASSVSVVTDGTIKTYPIPASDNITIEAEGLKSVEILSINGDIISKFMVNENVFTISIKTLPIGLYFIKAETNTGCVTKTIEKK